MAFDGRKPVDGIASNPAGDDVDEARRVPHQRLAGEDRAKVDRIQRFGMRRDQPELLETHARVDPLDPELQEPEKVRYLARRPRRADTHDLFRAVDAHGREAECPCAQASRLQDLR